MRDAVALAYSGRIPEARAAAVEQAGADDPFLVGQGLEALAVLGQQYEVRTDERIDALLAKSAGEGGAISRRAFEAAAAVQSQAVAPVAVERLASGDVTWDVLRYAGEQPSHAIARAFASGWERLPEPLLDEALLTSRVMPVANGGENDAWGERVLAHVESRSEEVRRAAFLALWTWRPKAAAQACAKALVDEVQAVREAAAQALAVIDLDLLADRVVALEEEYPEVKRAVPMSAMMRLAEARARRG